MSWLEKIFSKDKRLSSVKRNLPDGIWGKCKGCDKYLYLQDFKKNSNVCGDCNYHDAIDPKERLQSFLDAGSFQELADFFQAKDILGFKDTKKYQDRIKDAKKNTGYNEALIVGKGKLYDFDVMVCVFNFSFIGGSLSSAVGDKFVFACQSAIDNKIPLICFSASGGARMQESMLALMQMWRTSFMLSLLDQQAIPFISVITNPTFGGVSASLASLGDVNIAEPKALTGFAGQRVIKQTLGEDLPEGFQTSEYLLSKGMLDMIVSRKDMRKVIFSILDKLYFHKNKTKFIPSDLVSDLVVTEDCDAKN